MSPQHTVGCKYGKSYGSSGGIRRFGCNFLSPVFRKVMNSVPTDRGNHSQGGRLFYVTLLALSAT